MLRNFSLEERFDPIDQDEDLIGSVEPAAPSSWPLATTLWAVASALRDSLLAARRYEHLRLRGIDHDLALRMAIGVRHASSDIRPTARCQLSGPLARRRQEVFPEQAARSRGLARRARLAYVHGA